MLVQEGDEARIEVVVDAGRKVEVVGELGEVNAVADEVARWEDEVRREDGARYVVADDGGLFSIAM